MVTNFSIQPQLEASESLTRRWHDIHEARQQSWHVYTFLHQASLQELLSPGQASSLPLDTETDDRVQLHPITRNKSSQKQFHSIAVPATAFLPLSIELPLERELAFATFEMIGNSKWW